MDDTVLDGMVGEVISKKPSVEEVNEHLLEKLDTLIRTADAEDILPLTECLAKYNTSIRNNQIFATEESAEEKQKRKTAESVASVLRGE